MRAQMNRVFFVNRYFYPDHSATSLLLSDLAFELATDHEVFVITSRQLYESSAGRLPEREVIQNAHVVRVPTTQFGRKTLLGRAVDYLSFYVSAWRALRKLLKQGDIIVAMTDPPLVSLVALSAAKRRGARLVNWVQDVYPEVAVQLDIPFIRGPVGRVLSYLRDRTFRQATANVVVGERMRTKVVSHGAPADRVQVIHNWTQDQEILPVSRSQNLVRRVWDLTDKFVVGYSGNLGRAHEYETILAAAERLRAYENIVFLFIGGGHRMKELARTVKSRDLTSTFRFLPYQDRTELKYSLTVPDLHWISLRPSLEGLIVPSKFYSILAAGRPSIAITARDGEIARLVLEHTCGIVIEPGHPGQLAEAILQLSNDPQSLAIMGDRARATLDSHFSRQQALKSWREVLAAAQLRPD